MLANVSLTHFLQYVLFFSQRTFPDNIVFNKTVWGRSSN